VKLRPFLLLFMFLSTALLSGCWDRMEIQDFNTVSAIGIDVGDDDVDNRYLITVQVINEGQIAGAPGQGGKGKVAPVTTYSATGSNVVEALRKITLKLPREPFYPHVQIMVIGEELARQTGIQDLFDWIERNPQFRTLFPVLMVRDNTAENVLQIMTALEPIPSVKIVGGLKSTEKKWGEYSSTRADELIQQLSDGVALMTGIQITGDPEQGEQFTNVQQISPETKLEITGLAIIKEGKLQNWLDEGVARGAMLIKNETKETILNLNCEKKEKGIGVNVMRSKTNINVEIKSGKPIFHLTVPIEGHISEVQCPVDLSKYKVIEKLEKQMKKEVKEEILMAVEAAKEQKSDIFGFGEYVNRKDPKYWKKVKKEWDDKIFPETEINVTVQPFIRRTGLRTKSYIN
jgi:spore germination protein KC